MDPQTVLMELNEEHQEIVGEVRQYFLAVEGLQEEVRWGGCLIYRFPNGMRCYINARNKKYPILGISRGAWMVRQYPMLAGLFDQVEKVVAKIILKNPQTIINKAIPDLINRIASLPSGIGVLD